MLKKLLVCSLVCLFAQGCSEVSSEDVRTSGFWLDAEAISPDPTKLVVKAKFKTGSDAFSDYIELVGQDLAMATVDGRQRILTKEEDAIFGVIWYETTFLDLPDISGQDVTVTLYRENEDAIPSSVTMPDSFTIGAPSVGQAFDVTENDLITLSWSPTSSDDIAFKYEVSCSSGGNSYLDSGSRAIAEDTGVYSIRVQEILAEILSADPNDPADIPPSPATLSCSAELFIERGRVT